MGRWKPSITLAEHGEPAGHRSPVYLRIARAIASDVRRGRLKIGEKLPSTRLLAEELGINRNTVLAAYRELTAEGWVVMHTTRGTFVSDDLPEALLKKPRRGRDGKARGNGASGRSHRRPEPGYSLPRSRLVVREPRMPAAPLSMMGGRPDPRLAPVDELARAYRRALRSRGHALLDYGEPHGQPELRDALVEMLRARRGLAATPEQCLVTSGSQMILYLAARALFEPGAALGVEALGYRPVWESLRLGGVRLVPIPVDRDGLRVDRLRELTERHGLRGVYLTPQHQYPTTVTLSAARRLELMDFAERKRLVVLEDDYDHEFHYEGRPVLPVAASDPRNVVVYIGSMSKALAPGLRLGYVVAPQQTIERLTRYRSYMDFHGERVLEAAVAEMFEDGELNRCVNRARRAYRDRRDALVGFLKSRLGDVLSFSVPSGGMALWARVDESVDVNAWVSRALEVGVAFSPGEEFRFDKRRMNCARFGFAMLNEEEHDEATRLLVKALPRSGARTRASR